MSLATDRKTHWTAGRLDALRVAMTAHGLDAYLVPSVDEHINEYLPKDKERRAWASGFTGSAGDFLITRDAAWLFVDSRYHEQADYEVDTGRIQISKLGIEGEPSLTELIKRLADGRNQYRLGFDPFTLSLQQHQAFERTFAHTGIHLVAVTGNLVDPLWPDRPASENAPVIALPDAITGRSREDKLHDVRQKMAERHVDWLPVTKLDQIAWLFNLRGRDIPYNPLFISYALIGREEAHLFVDARRMEAAVQDAVRAVALLHPYEDYTRVLGEKTAGCRVLIDPKHTTAGTAHWVETHGGTLVEAEHPVELLKAVKNPVEIEGMRAANLKASRGKIRAWYWLEQQLAENIPVTEESFRQAIEGFYANEEDFQGLSFNTISGAGANASIVHYGTPDPGKRLEPGELFLIDSGCQFWGGTTDDTRTLIIGTPDALQTHRYTEVLKAHINGASQRFPKGTEGTRLDGVTRATLWQHGLDYGHGTGHGVGCFLNVHEGPNGIHKLASKPFQPGMITSIEPGFYEPGWGGIRLENLYLCVELEPGWYGFEALTYVPFDRRLIDVSRLSPEQLDWLQAYHERIVQLIAPTLPPEEAEWLQDVCAL